MTQCEAFRKTLRQIHDTRLGNIRLCIELLQRDSESAESTRIHVKELGLLQSELVVEEIVQEKSWEAVDRQCPAHRLL